jgi:hypothetical protein
MGTRNSQFLTVVEDGSFIDPDCYGVISKIAKSFVEAGEEISKILITWVNETEILATPVLVLPIFWCIDHKKSLFTSHP